MVDILSTGGIAEQLGLTRDSVEYVVRSRGIEPVAVVGGRRLFDTSACQRIKSESCEMARGKRRKMATAPTAVAGPGVVVGTEFATAAMLPEAAQ